jgi:hypothetical protein
VLFTLLGPFTFDTSIVPLLVRLIDSIVPLLNRPDTDEVIVLLRERVGGGGGGGGATDAIEIEDDDDDASAVLLLRDFRFGTSSSMKKQFVNTPLLVKKPCQDKKMPPVSIATSYLLSYYLSICFGWIIAILVLLPKNPSASESKN